MAFCFTITSLAPSWVRSRHQNRLKLVGSCKQSLRQGGKVLVELNEQQTQEGVRRGHVRRGGAFACQRTMRIVGLTGGIASGKSTVSNELRTLGVPIVDADRIAHDVLKKGTRGWKRVVEIFGAEILLESGEVNRARLGEIVFADSAKRKELNKALEPFIAFGIFCAIFQHWVAGTHVLVLDVPLLYEAKLTWITKPIVVVWVDRETQETRLLKRDPLSQEQARNRISAQLPLELKRDKADIVIDNSGTLEETRLQVNNLYTTINAPSTMKELFLSRTGVFVSFTGVAIVCWLVAAR